MNDKNDRWVGIGTELTPEQLEHVSGGSPFLPTLDLLKFLGSAASDVGHAVGHAIGTAASHLASDVGHAVASAGRKIASFFGF